MQMPAPTPQHERLHAFVGQWSGEETLHPSQWSPQPRRATGRFSCRMGMDGMFLVNDYEEERDGEIVFRGHGVYGWDPGRQRYTMHWFDSMGMAPSLVLGQWDDELVFTGSGEHGQSRYVYTLRGPDRMAFRIETSRDGEAWTPMMNGEYTRVPG